MLTILGTWSHSMHMHATPCDVACGHTHTQISLLPAHCFFYQLVLFGLLWLFVVLYYAWPSGGVPDEQRPAKPSTPRRTRSNEPNPFAGLTHKPHCAACEPGAEAHADAPPA